MNASNQDILWVTFPKIDKTKKYILDWKDLWKNHGTFTITTEQGSYHFRWKQEGNTLRVSSFSSIIREYYAVWNIENRAEAWEELWDIIAQDIIEEYETLFQKIRELYSGRVEKIMMFLEKRKEAVKEKDWEKVNSPLESALEAIRATFWPQERDTTITEVSSLFPQNPSLVFEQVEHRIIFDEQNKEHDTGLKQRTIFINGKYFQIRETTWAKPWDLEIHQTGTFFDFPTRLDKAHKDFIFSQLRDRKKVLTLPKIAINNDYAITWALSKKLAEFSEHAQWYSHRDISLSLEHKRNWEFMFWYLHFYNQSIKK